MGKAPQKKWKPVDGKPKDRAKASASPWRVAIATAQFNSEITERLAKGAEQELKKAGALLVHVRVTGAVELPLVCQALLQEGWDGVVALGAVIRGDTAHFESVCRVVDQGLTEVMLDLGLPIGHGILMTNTEAQAEARAGGDHGNKGAEAASAVLSQLELLAGLPRPPSQRRSR